MRCSTVKRFSNIESIQNTSIIQNGAHSPNFPVAMASAICVEAGLVENYFTTASIFSKLRQYPAIASIFILCPKLQALKTKCAIHGMHMADMGFLWLMVILSLGYRQPPPTSSLPMGVHRGEWQVPGNMGSQKKYTRNWTCWQAFIVTFPIVQGMNCRIHVISTETCIGMESIKARLGLVFCVIY